MRSQALGQIQNESKHRIAERLGAWGTFPSSQHFKRVKGVLKLQDGTRKSDKQFTHSHKPAQNQQTSWLAQSWNTFGVRMSHRRPRIHKTHHGPNLAEATTFPHILYSAPPYRTGIRMAFCFETPKGES
jgi:hypothetical protein